MKKKMVEGLVTLTTKNKFKIQRALAQFLRVNFSPDICTSVQSIAPENLKYKRHTSDLLRKQSITVV